LPLAANKYQISSTAFMIRIGFNSLCISPPRTQTLKPGQRFGRYFRSDKVASGFPRSLRCEKTLAMAI
jgi:hypothetical protein